MTVLTNIFISTPASIYSTSCELAHVKSPFLTILLDKNHNPVLNTSTKLATFIVVEVKISDKNRAMKEGLFGSH